MKQSVVNNLINLASHPVSAITDVFAWDRQFETGIAEIDLQHQKLVQLINLLGRILATETDTDSFVKALFSAS